MVSVLRRDVDTATIRCAEAGAYARANGLPIAAHVQAALGGWAIAAGGRLDIGLAEIVDHADAIASIRPAYLRPWFLALLADACVRGERYGEALRSIDTAMAVAEETGETWCLAELHRVRAEALAGIDPVEPRIVEELLEARRVAGEQGAIAWLRRVEQSIIDHSVVS